MSCRTGISHQEGRTQSRPNGKAYTPDYGHCRPPYPSYPTGPHSDPDLSDSSEHNEPMEPPYYVQNLVSHRSANDVKLPEEYRSGIPTERLYHSPPPVLTQHDRYRPDCAVGDGDPLPPLPGGDYPKNFIPQGLAPVPGGRRFSPLRLSFASGRTCPPRCSWKCAAICFIVVSLALVGSTVYLAVNSPPMVHPPQIAPPDGASFSALHLGEEVSYNLPPYGYWNLHLTLSDPTQLTMILTIPRGTNLGLYGRRNALPTHTQHDLMKILKGTRIRDSVSSQNVVEVSVEEVLNSGHWFLSLYNDDGDPHEVGLLVNRGPGGGECPQRCHGRGHCFLGRCQCEAGYSGSDCSEVLCPVLCSGRGDYLSGQCQCHPGWKGKECQLRYNECEVPDCNGHGHCVEGICQCAKGHTGKFCEIVDCPHPTCSGYGWCVEGTCVCQRGYKGPDCSMIDRDVMQCLPDCNGHGAFDITNHSCVCKEPWTGSDCSKKICSLDCGPHGVCENEVCNCRSGWTGHKCTEKLCDRRCTEHGQCMNGTCVCMTGWNGKHCTLPGCPQNCQGHGKCEQDEERQWSCRCYKGWDGMDCSAMLETKCSDGIDNDGDELTDCQDPECCSTLSCQDSVFCLSPRKPIDILLMKNSPGAIASFFEKMRFIIEEGSLQMHSRPGVFNESLLRSYFDPRRAAVIRGRVVTSRGQGIVGLLVKNLRNTKEGSTLTRQDGWFDLMVNGGGAVTLEFGKTPFSARKVQVLVPWNEVVVLDDIVMNVNSHMMGDFFLRGMTISCLSHDYELMRSVVMSTWQHSLEGGCPDVDAIVVETQAVQESIQIPGTGLYLVYHSSRARGYESTLELQLTPEIIPDSLLRIHLRILLEGILFVKVYEADPSIKYTYSWDRRNIYRQRVNGITTAKVSVGYEYSGCHSVIWEHRTVKVAGHDLEISRVGGFNLHVHHRYNFHQGILQKGDGRNVYLSRQRHLVTTLLGTGEQRDIACTIHCEGPAVKARLLAPTCLAAAPDGSLYVGDFNLVRRALPDGNVTTVARLNETRVSYRYHVAVSPLDGSVYISDPEAHQILKLIGTENVTNPGHNMVPVVGSGQRCLPGDRNKCGDGGKAIHARLTHPKGIAISTYGDLYIADGTNIRVVDLEGKISTLVGGHEHRSHWSPVPCNGTIERDQLRLRWPTELAISPLDGSLYILDDHLVLRLTPDSRVQVVTGRPLHCHTPARHPPDTARAAILLSPQSIAFSYQGDLYVAESDSQRINRVRMITTNGHISTVAGVDSKCNCRDPSCFCHTFDNVSASNAVFSSISAIAVTPDGVLHISEQAGYKIRSVKSKLPELNENKEYEIYSPDTHEVYDFNRFGQHVRTRNLVTGRTIYKFFYSVNMITGKLSSVTDATGNHFQLIRNYNGKVTAIENPQKQRFTIGLTLTHLLEELVAPDGYNITFRYHDTSGLIHSKIEAGGRTYNYEYDPQGRLTRAVMPTGQVIRLEFDLSSRGAQVTVTRDGEEPLVTKIRGNTLTHIAGPITTIFENFREGRLRQKTLWQREITLERAPYRVLGVISPTAAEMFPVISRQQTHIAKEPVNRYHWSYSTPGMPLPDQQGIQVSSTLQVNGADLLTLKYDPFSLSESLLTVTGQLIVNISYDDLGRPIKWTPIPQLESTTVTYDHWGYVKEWARGELAEHYQYDTLLRMISASYADNTSVTYEFKEQLTKPEKVTYPSGKSYGLVYDEAGALRQVVTPRGTAYTLHLSTSLGFYRLQLALPNDSIALQMRLDEQGRLLSMSQPGNGGMLLYEYDRFGRLKKELFGHGYTDFSYSDIGLLKTANSRHSGHDMRCDYWHRAGLAEEMVIRYSGNTDLHTVKIHYQYDGSARLRKIDGEINGVSLDEMYIRYDNQTGSLQTVQDLIVIRNSGLQTAIQNQNKQFIALRKLDSYGRFSSHEISINGQLRFLLQLKYDVRGRVSDYVVEVGGRQDILNMTYMDDGQLLRVIGGNSWLYTYDENGNIISYANGPHQKFLLYDDCDRILKAGDDNVHYDEKGFVVKYYKQNFEYNTKGQLVSAWAFDETWSFSLSYDHLGRVAVYRDHKGNVTQILYTRPDQQNLITHLHEPHRSRTTVLLYDDRNQLIAVDHPSGRYYVATDHNGTPLVFFDKNGFVVKQQRWSPFGSLADYDGSNVWVGIGPWGGFLEPITGIVILNGYAYHPGMLQWLSPRWEKLTQPTRQVTDVYVYRFRNNDPINSPGHLNYHYNDASDWLKLYGIELSKIMGSEYKAHTILEPKPVLSVDALAASEVVSGIQCQFKASEEHLQDLSFTSRSHIQLHVGAWKGAPISRQSSVFGPGVQISALNGIVLVTFVPVGEDGSSVIGDVIRTVLNGSQILDVASAENGKDVFYFIKDSQRKASGDIEHLSRLSGIFNVTEGAVEDKTEIRVSTPTAHLVILYEEDRERARNRILTQLEQQAETLAWQREAMLLMARRPGTRAWTTEETVELIGTGRVAGYIARHLHRTSRYPLLASDPSNVVFKRRSARKRRKSRRKGRKKGRRRRLLDYL